MTVRTVMASNIHSAEPAYPVLAHSLLQQPPNRVITPEQRIQGSTISEWDLHDDLTTGIKACSSGIFRCGSVVGFSRLRMRSSDNDEYIGEVRIRWLQVYSPPICVLTLC